MYKFQHKLRYLPSKDENFMSPVEISIYCDESEPQSIENEHWVYYGLLIIPENKKKELYNRLINARCIPNNKWVQNGCANVCGFHEKNNTELHYSELSRNHELRISKKWIKILYNECLKNEQIIYFNILGLNKTFIDTKYWQHHKNKSIKIYGRFLFTAIKSIKHFFPTANKIRINSIFHDKAALGEDSSPYYHRLIDDLRGDKRIDLYDSYIHFIDSDHRVSSSSIY